VAAEAKRMPARRRRRREVGVKRISDGDGGQGVFYVFWRHFWSAVISGPSDM